LRFDLDRIAQLTCAFAWKERPHRELPDECFATIAITCCPCTRSLPRVESSTLDRREPGVWIGP
jgi:hypothetical protein